MKITFIGAGSAFNKKDFQSNMLIEGESGKKLLLDCGNYATIAMQDMGIHGDNFADEIDAIYISHVHADHIGGLEEIAFCTFFNPNAPKIKLFCVSSLMHRLWDDSLKGGMGSYEGKVMHLTDYFECQPISTNIGFSWDGLQFQTVQTVHFMNGFEIVPSFGLLMRRIGKDNPTVFITTDTQFCPNQIHKFYDLATDVFHDCETAPFKSGVHAHYTDLESLSDSTRAKMWLYHYQPDPPQSPEEDGFQGFVQKGQVFEF